MSKTATLAKPADLAPVTCAPDDRAALQRTVLRILQDEYGGSDGLWAMAAKRATMRIMEAIYSPMSR
jgi:hypothetical protein